MHKYGEEDYTNFDDLFLSAWIRIDTWWHDEIEIAETQLEEIKNTTQEEEVKIEGLKNIKKHLRKKR